MLFHSLICLLFFCFLVSQLGTLLTRAQKYRFPFNNPTFTHLSFLFFQMNHIISALMAGNAFVGKVSEHASWSADYYGRIVKAALRVHGHNPDVVATVTGMAEAGVCLCSDPLVDKIIFTGSTPIGRKVMETASKTLTPVILELGGKCT
jgi:acyl-CoA reductase-like NAD-dependent aldehyde dehydrogenase